MKFLLPAIFLLLLGVGNIGVGHFKSEQYELVITELRAKDQYPTLADTSPSRRLQLARQLSTRSYQQGKKAQSKLDFYRLVTFGGQVFLGISFFLFTVSLLVRKRSSSRSLLQNKPLT